MMPEQKIVAKLNELRRALEPVLDKLGRAHGAALTVGQGRYDLGGRLSIVIHADLQSLWIADVRRYIDHRHDFDLPVIGTQYRYSGRAFRIVGMTPTLRVQVERGDGRRMAFSPSKVAERVRADAARQERLRALSIELEGGT